MTPQRIQLSRRKGWRKPEGAVVVARPSRWGNPYKVAAALPSATGASPWGVWQRIGMEPLGVQHSAQATKEAAMADAVERYRLWLPRTWLLRDLDQLVGKDLACWCPLTDAAGNRVPCHADVLLELSNPGWTP